LENRPFTRIYAFFNINSPNPIIHRISGVLGGNKRIVLQNSTRYNVELRNNSPYTGETIGYGGAQSYNTTFFVNDGNYTIFPVFRRFNTVINEIVTAYPEYPSTSPMAGRVRMIEFSLDDSLNEATINASLFVGTGIPMTAGAAFLTIQNNNTSGIGLWDGLARQITESGGQFINPNDDMTFPIHMGRIDGLQNKFEEERNMGGLRIGASAAEVQLVVPEFNFKTDTRYRIIVTGDIVTDGTIFLGTIEELGPFTF
jgi:hypothetical protein